MKRLWSQTASALILAATLAGCSRLFFDWNKRSFGPAPEEVRVAAPPPAIAKPREKIVVHPQSASVHSHKRKRPKAPPDMKEMSIQPETTENSAPPSATATISMAAPVDSSGNAEKEIEATSQRLAHFDRSQLSGPTLATYDQANGFLTQGKQALAEKDYVAASGFAQKATVLADRLQATVTAR